MPKKIRRLCLIILYSKMYEPHTETHLRSFVQDVLYNVLSCETRIK